MASRNDNNTCPFKLPNIIDPDMHPEWQGIQANFDYLLEADTVVESPLLGFGGTAVAGTYAYGTVAAEESTTSRAFGDLTTAGPSVTIDIPQNSFIIFTGSAKCWNTTAGRDAYVRLWNTSGNVPLASGNGEDTYSPGFSCGANSEPTYAAALSSNTVIENTADQFATNIYPHFPIFFHAGAALTGEVFTFQYRSENNIYVSYFKERKLAVLVLAMP